MNPLPSRTPLFGLLLLALGSTCQAAPDPLSEAKYRVLGDSYRGQPNLSPALLAGLVEDGLDEHEAVLLALARHPDLEAARARQQMEEADRVGAGLVPNPELEFEAEEIQPGGQLSGSQLNLVLRQQILTGGRYQRRIQAAQRQVMVAGWGTFEAGVRLAAETRSSFYQVLAARELLAISRDQEKLAGELLSLVVRRLRAGAANITERLRAEAFVTEVETQRLRAEARQGVVEAELRGLLVEVPESLVVSGQLPASHPTPEEGRVEKLLRDHSPLLARLRAELRATEAELSTQQASRKPNWTMGLGWRRDRVRDESSYLASVGVPLPTSDRNQGGILRAQAQVRESQAVLEGARLRLKARSLGYLVTLDRLHQQVRAFQEGVLPRARQALSLSRTGYERGKFLYINVLDSQRELFTALRRELELRLEYALVHVQLEALLGYPEKSHLEAAP